MDNKYDDVINPEVIEEVNGIKNNAIATIHNQLVEARYKLTVVEQRIFLALISLISPEDEDFKDYKIPVSTLVELIGTKHKNMYKVLNEATDRLMQRIIKIETLDESNKRTFKKFAFISFAEYKEGEGYFTIGIDKRLKPYLLMLKEKFTRIPLQYIFPLRSTYAIRLYELLKQYENTGFRVDYLPDLREMLGVEPEEYPRFDNFEKRVLKTAVKEINEKTDIEVSYKKKRTGRKITHIEFEIKSKRKKAEIGDTTETAKIPSESLDIQGQKQVEKNCQLKIDLWATVLTILENRYDAEPDDIDLLQLYVYPIYKTNTEPKKMVLHTDIATEKGRQAIREILKKYINQIQEIVKVETFGNYVVKISKSIVEKGKELPFG